MCTCLWLLASGPERALQDGLCSPKAAVSAFIAAHVVIHCLVFMRVLKQPTCVWQTSSIHCPICVCVCVFSL